MEDPRNEITETEIMCCECCHEDFNEADSGENTALGFNTILCPDCRAKLRVIGENIEQDTDVEGVCALFKTHKKGNVFRVLIDHDGLETRRFIDCEKYVLEALEDFCGTGNQYGRGCSARDNWRHHELDILKLHDLRNI